MVDINLIGDDNGGEERAKEATREDMPEISHDVTQETTLETEPVDEFSQTSGLDTHELAFEERTETFDTTRTAGFTHGRSSSSLNILMIVGGIVLVAAAIWFFVLREPSSVNQPMEALTPPTQETGETEQMATTPEQPDAVVSEETTQPEPVPDLSSGSEQANGELPPATAPLDRQPVGSVADYAVDSRVAVASVAQVLGPIGGNLSTTLLSYAGRKIRFEYVASAQQNAGEIAARLNHAFATRDFAVLSEREVSVGSQTRKKVLVSGTVNSPRESNGGAVDSWTVERVESWISTTAQRLGLEIRQLRSQEASRSNGEIRTPLLTRLVGPKASLVRFMEAIASEGLNVELTKILFVSPDMATFSDQNLILMLNMFVHQS